MKKPFPSFDSDEKLEAFLDTADLDEYDLAEGAMPRDDWFARCERLAKDASILLGLPEGLLDAVRNQAARSALWRDAQRKKAVFGRRRQLKPSPRRAAAQPLDRAERDSGAAFACRARRPRAPQQ
jgi:predicted DNA binding CopG/RHH family protein